MVPFLVFKPFEETVCYMIASIVIRIILSVFIGVGGDQLPSSGKIWIADLKQTSPACGTELTIVQEGIPEVIPIEMCYLGWQESLLQLVNLVEPEIPDGA